MSALPEKLMTVDEYLAWAEGQEGRFELWEGRVIAMSPERARHAIAKSATYNALRRAIRRADIACHAMPDGMTVRIDNQTAYEPDALVYCGPKVSGDVIEIPNPAIILEVVSPSTGRRDLSVKLAGYMQVQSVLHYLIVDPDKRVIIHHRRGSDGAHQTRIIHTGTISLDPPGIELGFDECFDEAD